MIDRGLAYACGGAHGGHDGACEEYFCYKHLAFYENGAGEWSPQLCPACGRCWETDGEEDGNADWAEEQRVRETFLTAMFEELDSHIKAGELDKVDAFLQGVDVTDVDGAVLVRLLKVTLPHSIELSSRGGFLARVRAEMRKQHSEKETESLLKGLA